MRVEDLTKFEGECPNIVVFGTYMDIRVPLTKKWKTGCDLIILGGTNCDEGGMDWLFGSLGNENFYICQPLSFYKSQREIEKVNPLYAFKLATAYFRGQGMVPVFEDSNCRLIKL